MVHPRLIARAVITGKNRAIVIHLQFPTPSRRVFVLVDVLDLVGSGRFAKIRRAAEETYTRLLRQSEGGGHGGEEQTPKVIDIDPFC